MTPLEKWRRLTNPKTAEDYGLSVTLREMMETPEIAAEVSAVIGPRLIGRRRKGSLAEDAYVIAPSWLSYDAQRNVIQIHGINWSVEFFERMAFAPPGRWLRIEHRKGGIVTVYDPGEDASRRIDILLKDKENSPQAGEDRA